MFGAIEPEMKHLTVKDTDDFWEDLKQKLEEELTQDEQAKISFLLSDRINLICKEKGKVLSIRDLLSMLEDRMFYDEALALLEHVFAYEDHYIEFEDRSFGQMITEYRSKVGCSNIIGREDEICGALDTLDNSLSLWIYGMGGLGKTLLADKISGKLAYSRNTSVFKFDFKQVQNTVDVIKSILAKFEVFTSDVNTKVLTSELICQLKGISNETCMVLDNIEDVYESDTEELTQLLQRCFDVAPHMPVKWIITSRIPIDADNLITGISQIKLEPLNVSRAKTLLRLSIRPIEISEEKCQRILEMTGGNPLAIRLTSSAVKYNCPKDTLVLDNLTFVNERLQNGMIECIEYAYMSLTEVEKNQLKSLSVAETSQFDLDIVNAVLGCRDGHEAILLMMKLISLQLVQIIEYGQYCLHPLIYDYIRDLPDYEKCSLQAQDNFCCHMIKRIEPYIQQADKNYIEAISKVSENQPLLKVLFRILSTRKDDSNNLLTPNVNKCLIQLRDMIPMTHLEKKGLYKKLTEQMHSCGRKEAFLFWKLEEIRMMIDDKRFADAEMEFSDIYEKVHEKSIGEDIMARYWYIKGRYFRLKGYKEYTKAIECFTKSLKFNTNINDVPESAMAYNALGKTYFDMNDDDKALSYHQKAHDLLESFTSNNLYPDLSVYEFNLGTTYLAKASKELAIYKSVTDHARENLKMALDIFEKSMAKDERMKLHRMPKYGNKLAEKAKALFYLSDDVRGRENAIANMKNSLKLKIDPYTEPDKNKTLAFFKTGQIFIRWREEVLHDASTAKLLLKEAIICFRKAEDDIKETKTAGLDEKDKDDFISVYRKVASQGLVSRSEAKRIKYFCQQYENGFSSDSSASSPSSSTDMVTSISRHHSDEGNQSLDEDIGGGIMSTRDEKQIAHQFENNFFDKINNQAVSDKTTKRKRRSVSSKSD